MLSIDSGESGIETECCMCYIKEKIKSDTKCVSGVPKHIDVMVQEMLAPTLEILQFEDLVICEKDLHIICESMSSFLLKQNAI